ncbi:hypothetical protein [Kitasatospora sp. NPDC093679]|uniref:hypothetical protein n=1 Tax=Kitasatospora sp. NPDC093679 TaxID=3154983 RepID=UPI0034265430
MSLLLLVVAGTYFVIWLRGPHRTSRAATWAATVFDPAAYGLVPHAVLDPRRPGPPAPPDRSAAVRSICEAAWTGDWQPAAAYVEAAGGDWDERWSRLELLADIAEQDDAWLTAWRAADPAGCAAATLEARCMVDRAWAIRGSGYAHQVPADRMAKFRELLPAAIEAAQRAALLAPEDPGPWVVMVLAARGAQYTPDRFGPLWDGLVARAPHHYEGHWQAMQYWCAKWYGSNRKMMAFARRAVDKAPAGSPLPGIYVHALSELETRSGLRALPRTRAARRRLKAVAQALATVPADDPRLPALRHLLADHLAKAGLHAAALEQFRLVGRWCGGAPWADRADPVAAFDLARGIAVRLSRTKPLPPEARNLKDTVLHHHG